MPLFDIAVAGMSRGWGEDHSRLSKSNRTPPSTLHERVDEVNRALKPDHKSWACTVTNLTVSWFTSAMATDAGAGDTRYMSFQFRWWNREVIQVVSRFILYICECRMIEIYVLFLYVTTRGQFVS